MINASRPFVVNEWITATIDGVEISGVVEVSVFFNYFSFTVDMLFCLFHFMYVFKQ